MKVEELPKPLIRRHVWRIRFKAWETRKTIEKFAVLLQGGEYFRRYESVCVVLLTTSVRKKKRPTDVLIPPEEHSAGKDVWASCGQVWTIPVDDLIDSAYVLSPATMEKIDVALTFGLGMVH